MNVQHVECKVYGMQNVTPQRLCALCFIESRILYKYCASCAIGQASAQDEPGEFV